MEKYKGLTSAQKIKGWIILSIAIGIVVAIPTILVLAPWQANDSPSLDSRPNEIYGTIQVGMSLDDVYWMIDHDYADEACHLVNYESLSPYEPTRDSYTDYFVYIFMPLSGRTPATVVWFYYDSLKDTSTVLDISRMDYYEAQWLIVDYGYRTFW